VWHEWYGRATTPRPSAAEEEAEEPASPLPFVLLLILTGSLLTIGPEFVYLRDNFGVRINTVFKFYYQAWVLFGVAAPFALFFLAQHFRRGVKVVLPLLAIGGYAVLFGMGLLFPLNGVPSRAAEFRGPADAPERVPPTLNGLAHIQRYNAGEYDAIMWLRNNIEGNPTILEAVGGQYSNFGRFSASTGLPTVLGWAGHQYQWRGSDTPEPAERDPAVADIYRAPAWESGRAAEMLNKFDVELIVVGQLEQTAYGDNGRLPGAEKFTDRLQVAYENSSVTIYRWHPE